LRSAGKKEAAEAVRALRKPPVSVWAVNQLARRRPEDVRTLVKAGEQLRKAQRGAVARGDSDALRQAQRAHRDLVNELTETARDVLSDQTSAPTLTRLAQTLRAASIDKEAAKALVTGTLSAEVEQAGFGPLLTAVPSSVRKRRPKPKPKPKSKPTPDPKIKQREKLGEQLDKARRRVRELEARLDELGGR
jgi:hypothetical protein